MRWLVILAAAAFTAASYASDVGQIKNLSGAVHVERDGQRLAAAPGMGVKQADVLVTGADGSVGVTFLDNSLLSLGPSSTLAIDRYAFNSTTHDGQFDASLKRGTLAVVSGRMVKRSPDAMRVRTPSAIMGVRGTEFVVKVDEPAR
ncbi:MAG TPA: FecR domain-containing protein [Burkholderiales bacterium]|nr:FecR domain-containing protein [Burkholderiales bacterium]